MPTPRTHSAYRHTLAPPMYRSKLAFFARRFVNIYICVGDVLGEHTEGHHLPTRTHGLNCCRVTEPSAAHPSSWPYRLGSSRPTLTPYTPNWYSPAQLNLPSANGQRFLFFCICFCFCFFLFLFLFLFFFFFFSSSSLLLHSNKL